MPDPNSDPHTLAFDKHGMLFFSFQASNQIGRLNPKTGEFVEYPMPTTPGNFDGKKLSFDPTAKDTVIFFSNPRNAQILRVEFLD